MTEGFKVVERIGGGEFLDLWTGVHQATNTNVNVHILDKKKLGNAFDSNRFNLLCDFVLTLNHPNVLKCYKVVANDKSIAVVTEPIQGRSLRDYLVEKNNKRLPENEARLILRQIVEGVSYLHANNIVHRNLTLHNIYISGQGEIRLGNLLICAKSTDMGKPVTNQKSDCYFFAPELWDPNQEYDTSCDLWSIGVILYVLVCGCYPFDGKNEISVYLAAKHARFMIPNFITAECSSLIRQLLMPAKEARMKLEEIKYHPWYNNLSVPLLRQSSSQNSFGYSLHSIPESLNENEDQQVKQEDPSEVSLSDFGLNYAFNIPLEVGPNTTAPIVEIPTTENNNNNSDSPEGPRRRYSYSLPSSPIPTTLEELIQAQNEPGGAKMLRIPSGRKRSADQEQILAMFPARQGSFGMDEPVLPNLGTTPPQPRKRTGSINESKEIINMLEMPPLENDVSTLSSDFAGLGTEDSGSATNSPAKGRRKKSDPSSPKSSSKKGSTRRTYRRRSLDDFSHLMVGPNTNPDLPTYGQVFQEAPKESSFGFQVPQPQGTPGNYSPTMARSPTTGYGVPKPHSPATSMPMSPVPMSPAHLSSVIYPGVPNDFATLAFLEQQHHQMQHMASNPDLPVQPPKITPMVFYAPPEMPHDPSSQYLPMQYPPFMHGGLYQAPQTSQFDVPPQYFPVPATDSETMSAPIDTGATHKHVSNFVGSVIPETEEEWANNVVNRKCDVMSLTD